MKNHTDLPKTIPIECKGYRDDTGKMQFAKGHTELRLVHAQDVKQCVRCEACQKAHAKVRTKTYRAGRAATDRAKKVQLKATEAEAVMKEYGDRLSKAQIAELKKAKALAATLSK